MSTRLLLILTHFALCVNCAVYHNNVANIPKNVNSSNELTPFVDFLQTSLNKTVLAYNLTDLSSLDPHFGGTLRLINVKVAANDTLDGDKVLKLVLKTSLQNTDYGGRLLNFKECRFFTDVIPALKAFEASAKIPEVDRANMFPQYFGCRLSLDPNAEMADSDYALLLENLKIRNYTNPDSFTIDEVFVCLKAMAKFHASFIAMRRLQPLIFNVHVRPFSMNAMFQSNIDEMLETITKELNLMENLSWETRIAVINNLPKGVQFLKEYFRPVETPYTTICHRDLKKQNIMINRDTDNTVKVKFIDFQLHTYRSFVHDLLSFLLNLSNDVLIPNFMNFVKAYHAEFYEVIRNYKCPSEDYTYDKVWQEIQHEAKCELFVHLNWIKWKGQHLKHINRNSASEYVLHNWKSIIHFYNVFGFLEN